MTPRCPHNHPMVKAGRALGAAALLTLSFALWAPLTAMACSAGGGGTAAASGGGQVSTFSSIGGPSATDAVSVAFTILAVISLLAISVAVIILRRRRPTAVMAQLSPDGTYWWDGIAWHDGVLEPPPPGVRSADGAYSWDGRAWRTVSAN